MRIVGKRRTSRGDEYKVRWKSTWLPGSELRSAQRLVREFEARGRVLQGPEKRGPNISG